MDHQLDDTRRRAYRILLVLDVKRLEEGGGFASQPKKIERPSTAQIGSASAAQEVAALSALPQIPGFYRREGDNKPE
jgi:hypothetical protein